MSHRGLTPIALAARRLVHPILQPTPRRRVVIGVIVLILLVSTGLRLYGLSYPQSYMFDEVYYAKDARAIAQNRVSPDPSYPWMPLKSVSWPHPEMGKFAIALGIKIFGDRPLGWRLPAVVAGLALLACVYPLARRLGLSPSWSLLALLFAAADPLGIVQSRIGTLDIFVALWTVVCIWLTLRAVQSPRGAGWLALAGIAGGLALATKWSGLLALIVAAALIAAGRCGRRRSARQPLALGLLTTLAAFVFIPAVIYVACYAQYFAAGHSLSDWVELHSQMFGFGIDLHAKHSYASWAPTWIADYRPVWYHYVDQTKIRGVVAIGNPFLWWTAGITLLAAPAAAFWARRPHLLVPTAIVVGLYVPWFFTSRTAFLYYMAPVAPFLAVLAAAGLALLVGRPSLGVVRWLVIAAAALLTALIWRPLAAGSTWLFWTKPAETSTTLAWLATGLGIVIVAVAVSALLSPPLRRLRPGLALLLSGAIVGIVVAFIPIALALPISRAYFDAVTWLGSWI